MLQSNPTFRSDVAVEMQKWCKEHCLGEWEIVTPDITKFEFPTDAKQFELYFWMPTVSFGV